MKLRILLGVVLAAPFVFCQVTQLPGGGGGAGTGTVTSVVLAGTDNQITVTGTCTITDTGTCTFSIPSNLRIPGTINKLTLTQPATGATITVLDGKTVTVNKTFTFDGTDSTTITFPATSATVARTDAGQTFTGTQVFSALITGAISGNAGTATALAANGTNCSAGSFPLGVDASGNSESCTVAATGNALTANPLSQFASTTSAQLLATLSDPTGTGVAVFGTSPTLTTPAITTSGTVTRNGIGSTSTDGWVLTNTTPALTGQQQYSPRFRLIGQGWGTTAPATAQGEIILENAVFRDTTVAPRLTVSYIEAGGSQTTLLQSMPLPGFHTLTALYVGTAAATGTNYTILSDNSGTLRFNGTTSSALYVNNSAILQAFSTGVTINGHIVMGGSTPTLTAGTGTIAGKDVAGRVTLTAGSQTTITVTFAAAWSTNIPICTANDETTALLVQAQPTLTTLVLNASFGAADKITWHCIGY